MDALQKSCCLKNNSDDKISGMGKTTRVKKIYLLLLIAAALHSSSQRHPLFIRRMPGQIDQ